MDRNTMKDKIKKLLALSTDNPSEAESFSALQKAQALMAQYKIEEGELTEEEKNRECVAVKTAFSYSSNSSDTYMCQLAEIIADNFCCVTYNTRMRGSRTRHVVFMGYEEDVNVAIEAMTIANMAIYRGYNIVWKDMCDEYNVGYIPAKIFNPAKIGYIKGYLKGLKEVLDSQKEQNQQWGLVLVAPQEAQNFVGGLRSETLRSQTISNQYRDMGYQDGLKFNMNKKIEEGTRLLED